MAYIEISKTKAVSLLMAVVQEEMSAEEITSVINKLIKELSLHSQGVDWQAIKKRVDKEAAKQEDSSYDMLDYVF